MMMMMMIIIVTTMPLLKARRPIIPNSHSLLRCNQVYKLAAMIPLSNRQQQRSREGERDKAKNIRFSTRSHLMRQSRRRRKNPNGLGGSHERRRTIEFKFHEWGGGVDGY